MINFRTQIENFFNRPLDQLYPERMGSSDACAPDQQQIHQELMAIFDHPLSKCGVDAKACADKFLWSLVDIKNALDQAVLALDQGDPAAESRLEIILAYPGFVAAAAYRMANVLYRENVKLVPRIITEHAHSVTGIDIHPGATIGKRLCIDHGTGVVIGETTVIGNDVKLYQGVTLGALSIPKGKSKVKRHPTIEDNVVIYAQASILGGETVIGKNSIIGGNVWITESVPANTKVLYQGSTQKVESIRLKSI